MRIGVSLSLPPKPSLLSSICCLVLTAPAALAQQVDSSHVRQDDSGSNGEHHAWPFWGGNISNTHGSGSEHVINAGNAGQLQQKWVFTTAGDVSATPTVEHDSVYVPDWGGYLYRIDARTGKAFWSHKVSEYTGDARSISRTSPAIGRGQIVIGDQARATMLSINKASGKLLWQTNVEAAPGAIITTSPVISGGVVYVGVSSIQEALVTLVPGFKLSFRGSLVALDLQTGKVLWQTYTVPPGYTGGAVWSSTPAIDLKRNSVYFTSGNNYSMPDAATACLRNASGTDAAARLACLAPDDNLDAMIALDLTTGKVKWARRLEGADTFTDACNPDQTSGYPCPDPRGPDYDFGGGVNLFTVEKDGKRVDVVGAGQKSGVYWTLNADTGAVLWGTQVGPGGQEGGILWGTATDGKQVYAEVNNSFYTPFLLQPDKQPWSAGSWAALDAMTGKPVWQVPASGTSPTDPRLGSGAPGQVTVANGVFYAGALSGDMVALDAATGKTLWTFASGGSVVDGPSIVDGTIYWGSGYGRQSSGGTANNKLYAFSLPDRH